MNANFLETQLHQDYTKFRMSYSVKVKIRTDRIRKDGTSMIFLQVLINSKIWRHNLELHWPAGFFSEKDLCKKRFKNDPDVNDYNIVIRDALARINEIFKYYRLTNQVLTLELFDKEYNNPLSKTDFIKYFGAKMTDRYNNGDIEYRTYLNHKNTLTKLKAFSKSILFCNLNYNFSYEFDRFLRNKCSLKKANGRWGHHKDVKTYLAIAKKDKIAFENPYEGFKNTSTPGEWKPISKDSLNKLYKYYKEHTVPGTSERWVLQRFLFGCLTGLRISDQIAIKRNQVIGGNLVFMPFKGRKKGKLLVYPLLPKALELVNDSMKENNCDTIFVPHAAQPANKILKDIAAAAEIEEKLHHHVGRETYGTEFIAAGGSVTTLQKYYDHYKITTTMKYVHESEERVRQDVAKMVDLIK